MRLTAAQIRGGAGPTAIRSGQLQPGALMPSERELIERFGTTKSTAGKAIALLQAEGLVRTETGRGTFVQDIPKVKRVRRIPPRGDGSGSSFAEEMRKAGLTPSTKLVQAEAGRPPAAVAERLELGEDEQALIRKRHMFTDGRPAQLGRVLHTAVGRRKRRPGLPRHRANRYPRPASRTWPSCRAVRGRGRIASAGRGRGPVPAHQPHPACP